MNLNLPQNSNNGNGGIQAHSHRSISSVVPIDHHRHQNQINHGGSHLSGNNQRNHRLNNVRNNNIRQPDNDIVIHLGREEHHNNYHYFENQPQKKQQYFTNIELNTQYKIEDVECRNFQSEIRAEKLKFKYYCPICLRYFNTILVSQCCNNYICLLCINDLQEQEHKDSQFKAVCPYGCQHFTNSGKQETQTQNGKFILKDVPMNSEIKKYSDSQKMSIYSKKITKSEQVLKEEIEPQVQEDQEQIQKQSQNDLFDNNMFELNNQNDQIPQKNEIHSAAVSAVLQLSQRNFSVYQVRLKDPKGRITISKRAGRTTVSQQFKLDHAKNKQKIIDNIQDKNTKINLSQKKEESNKLIIGSQEQKKLTDNLNNNFSKTFNERILIANNSNNPKYNKSGMKQDENNLKIPSQQEFERCSFGDSQIDQIEIVDNEKKLNQSAHNAYDSSFRKLREKNKNYTNQFSFKQIKNQHTEIPHNVNEKENNLPIYPVKQNKSTNIQQNQIVKKLNFSQNEIQPQNIIDCKKDQKKISLSGILLNYQQHQNTQSKQNEANEDFKIQNNEQDYPDQNEEEKIQEDENLVFEENDSEDLKVFKRYQINGQIVEVPDELLESSRVLTSSHFNQSNMLMFGNAHSNLKILDVEQEQKQLENINELNRKQIQLSMSEQNTRRQSIQGNRREIKNTDIYYQSPHKNGMTSLAMMKSNKTGKRKSFGDFSQKFRKGSIVGKNQTMNKKIYISDFQVDEEDCDEQCA